MENIQIRIADYTNPADQSAIKFALNEYSKDPMGRGKALNSSILEKTVQGLKNFPTAFTLIAYENENVMGIVNCFLGFSTFKALPTINIHDLSVIPEARGKKIGSQLLDAVINEAQRRGCCRVTLEVREDNRAKKLYLSKGFADNEGVLMEFLSKELL